MYFRNWSPEFIKRHRIIDDLVVIEIAINTPYDLYEDKDPSPLKTRDLKPSVETYLIHCLREIPKKLKVRIDFCFYEFSGDENEKQKLEKSVKSFLKYRAVTKKIDFRFRCFDGFKAIVIGLLFLFLCIYIQHISQVKNPDVLYTFYMEGLSVLGWVSLWNPVQIFLYEVWPILSYARSLKRCSELEMQFRTIDSLNESREYLD